ncbi:hypothetical protein [Neisseria elongata]|nr:hypothetical protein [Neisseria elongata]
MPPRFDWQARSVPRQAEEGGLWHNPPCHRSWLLRFSDGLLGRLKK